MQRLQDIQLTQNLGKKGDTKERWEANILILGANRQVSDEQYNLVHVYKEFLKCEKNKTIKNNITKGNSQ
jgi:hypothetical protein